MDTRHIIKAVLAVAISFSLIACGSKEPEIILPEPAGELTGSFSIVNSDGTTFSMDAIRAGYEITGNTVDITLYSVSFSPRMPRTLDMTIPGINCALTAGSYSLSGDNIVPTALGRPFENYMVTGLTGTLTDTGLALKMQIGGCPSEYRAGN